MFRSTTYISILLIFGLIYIFITPPFQVPDSENHFYRAYQIATGNFVSEKKGHRTGGELPKNLPKTQKVFARISFYSEKKTSLNEILSTLAIKVNPQQTQLIGFENTAVFSPVPYLPAAFGIKVGSFLTDSVLLLYYIASICTFLASLAILRFAMFILPQYNLLIFAYCLSPMFLFQMASVSADSLSNALSLLFISLIFSVVIYHTKVDKTFLVMLLICGILLALCKQTYSILFILIALIGPKYFESIKSYINVQLLFFISIVSVIFIWTLIVNDIYSPLSWVNGADAKLQLKHVLNNPVNFLTIAFTDLTINFRNYVLLMAGAILGWLDTRLPFSLIWLHIFSLFLLSLTMNSINRLSLIQYSITIFTVLSGIVLIELALYLHAQPVGATTITGIHGRYFLHLFFLTLLLCATFVPKFKANILVKTTLTLICFIPYLISIPIILDRYYL